MLPDVTKFIVFFDLFPSSRFFFWPWHIFDRLDILLVAMFCIRKHRWTYQFFGEKIMVLNNSTNLLADCNENFLTLFVVIFIIEQFFLDYCKSLWLAKQKQNNLLTDNRWQLKSLLSSKSINLKKIQSFFSYLQFVVLSTCYKVS